MKRKDLAEGDRIKVVRRGRESCHAVYAGPSLGPAVAVVYQEETALDPLTLTPRLERRYFNVRYAEISEVVST